MTAFRLALLVVAALVFAQFNEWRVLDQLALALVALLVGAFVWSRSSLRGIAITRRIGTDRAQVGQVLGEEIVVENRSRLGKLWLELHDLSTLPGHHPSRVINIGGRSRRAWTAATRCSRRGRYRIGPIVLRAGDPFGIFPVARMIPVQLEVLVYPAAVGLIGFNPPAGLLTGGAAAERRTSFITPSVAGIREYVPGDAFNRISWTASARLGRLMVKEFDIDPTSDIWIVLDLDRAQSFRVHQPLPDTEEDISDRPLEAWLDATEEYAIAIVASLARRCLDQGRAVGLIATAAHYEVLVAERSDRQYVKILETLAVIQADGNRPLAEVLVAEARRFTRQSGLIVVTSSTDERWVTTLASIAGRRVKALAVVIDPASFGAPASAALIVNSLVAADLPVRLVSYGDMIATALSAQGGGLASTVGSVWHG